MDKRKIKLNLGCGLSHFENSEESNWINIDIEPEKKPDLLIDCTKRLPYEDNSIDEIYAGHYLEHITFNDMIKVIEECKRILKPGCLVIFTIPDMFKAVDQYKEGRILRNLLDQIAFGKEPNPANNHKQILDEDYLTQVLYGYFKNVQTISFSHHVSIVTPWQTIIRCIK